MTTTDKDHFRFEVAFSFGAENRELVRSIASALRERIGEGAVFYDEWYVAELARPNLDLFLQTLYRESSRLVIVCVGEEYRKKPWAQLEWNAIRQLQKELQDPEAQAREQLRVLPIRVGGGEVGSAFDTTAFLDVRERPLEDIVRVIVERLNRLRVSDGLDPIEHKPARPTLSPIEQQGQGPEVFVSYNTGQDQREPLVDDLCRAIRVDGYRVIVDKTDLALGERISTFMDRIGRGGCIIIILSKGFIESDYCVYELFRIYTEASLDAERFLSRVIPLVQSGLRIARPIDRIQHAVYWKKMREELNTVAREHGVEVLGKEDFLAHRRMSEFAFHVSDMLAYMSDRSIPRTMDEIRASDFQVVRELEQFSKEISEKRKKELVQIQVIGNKVMIAPPRVRA